MASLKVDRRWCWNTDRTQLVPETHPDAAWLAYTVGQEVAEEEARRVGLTRPAPAGPTSETPSDGSDDKAAEKPADKARRAAPNK